MNATQQRVVVEAVRDECTIPTTFEYRDSDRPFVRSIVKCIPTVPRKDDAFDLEDVRYIVDHVRWSLTHPAARLTATVTLVRVKI